MKFTDGNWLIRSGVQPFYPTEAHEIEATADTLTVYATRAIRHRGDTLIGPLLTVTFSSPLADVIRVRLTHFAGGGEAQPQFALLQEQAPTVKLTNDATAATLTSGNLSLHIAKDEPWQVNYRVAGHYYVVDRLFGAAELRLGAKTQQIVRITRTEPRRRKDRRAS